MKSKFLNAALLSALVVGVPMGVSSCKDYDDDINRLDGQYADLQKQIAALQSSIDSYNASAQAAANEAKQAAAAAQSTADAAAKAAAEAKAEAAAAQAAADKAKADAIAEIKALLEKELAGKADKSELQALAERLTGVDNRLATLEAAFGKPTDPDQPDTSLNEAVQALKTQVQALQNFQKEIEALNLSDKLAKIETLNNTITTINSTIADLQGDSKRLKEQLDAVAAQVGAIHTNLVTISGSALRSLVFQPSFYWHGIEAIHAGTYVYKAITMPGVNPDTKSVGDSFQSKEKLQDSVRVTPALVMDYHMNPSSAVVPTDPKAYSLLAGNYAFERGTDANVVTPTVYEVATAADGTLTVKANLKHGRLPLIDPENKLTSMALQVKIQKNGQDTTITSDYAAVKATNDYGFRLADASKTAHQAHWPTTAEEAIESNAAIPVAYNSMISVSKYVDTHVSTTSDFASDYVWDAPNATSGKVRDYGFKYEYQLVGYMDGNHATSESAHAALSTAQGLVAASSVSAAEYQAINSDMNVQTEVSNNINDIWLRPQITKDGKQQAWGAEQNEATIDREPLVRVALKDTISGEYAAVGFIKFVIVPADLEDTVTPIDPFEDKKDVYVLTCPLRGDHWDVTWDQVEERILAKLGVSKTQFEEEFKPDFANPAATTGEFNAKVLNQFNRNYTARTAAQNLGTIGFTNDDTEGLQTNIFCWSFTPAQLYQYFVTQGKTSLDVTVRFVKEWNVTTGSNHVQTLHHYVYVTFVWTPAHLDITPSGSINDNNKINNMWYKPFSAEHGGFAETHENVEVPRDGATCKFESSMLYPWVANNSDSTMQRIFVTLNNPGDGHIYHGFWDKYLKKYFNFKETQEVATAWGVSGREYAVRGNGVVLEAAIKPVTAASNWQPIAVISTPNFVTTTTWANDNVNVTYQDNEYALDILSAYSSQDLAQEQTSTGTVEITVENDCNLKMPVANNTYNLRFLRPVNLLITKDAEMIDAHNDGAVVKLADLLDFSDWRYNAANVESISLFSANPSYYQYYGIEQLYIGTLDRTLGTNALVSSGSVVNVTYVDGLNNSVAANKDLLGNIAPKMDLVYTPATTLSKTDMGTLTYYNNGETFNKPFDIYVPVVVTYKWGWLVPGHWDYKAGTFAQRLEQQFIKITVKKTYGE